MATSLPYKVRGVAASLLEHVPSAEARALADPPPGSGLEPVMGEPGPPVVGHTLLFLKDNLGWSRHFYEKYGTIFWGNSLGTKVVSVLGPDGLETVLTNRDRAFSNAEGWAYFIGPFFERGVMLMDFEEHRHHRRILQKAFKRVRIVGYIEKANETIARVVPTWRPGPGFQIYNAAKQLTLDIATEVFVGGDIGAQADRINRAFIDTVLGGQAIVRSDVPGGKWHRGLASRRLLEDYFRAQIPEKRAGDGDDLFSVLCHAESEDGERFSDDDVVNHMIFTMMAAHDTSTITLAMMGYYLAKHPEWQERVREESRALGTDTIGYDEAEQLTAMDLVFRETLRMNAPVGALARQAIKDTEIDGRYIPAGTRLFLGLYATMRMEPWWNDPDTFDPERFTPERAEDQSHKYAWTPFGGNVHKCIGMHFGAMEVKAIMHQLLLRHSLHVDPDYEPPMDHGTGPLPADGLPLELRPLR
jgi:cytochrome P450